MKRKVTWKRPTKFEGEVELPLYRKYELYASKSYMRVREENGRLIEDAIEFYSVRVTIARKEDYAFDGSTEEYNLGLGKYASSVTEFNEAVDAAMQFLRRAGGDDRFIVTPRIPPERSEAAAG